MREIALGSLVVATIKPVRIALIRVTTLTMLNSLVTTSKSNPLSLVPLKANKN